MREGKWLSKEALHIEKEKRKEEKQKAKKKGKDTPN